MDLANVLKADGWKPCAGPSDVLGVISRLDHPDRAIAKAALRILRDYSWDEKERMAIVKAPGVPTKLFAMLGSGDPYVIEHAAGTLTNIAHDDSGETGRKPLLLALAPQALEALSGLIEAQHGGSGSGCEAAYGPTTANDTIAEGVFSIISNLGTEKPVKQYFSRRENSVKRMVQLLMDRDETRCGWGTGGGMQEVTSGVIVNTASFPFRMSDVVYPQPGIYPPMW